ncbi:MAG TPA: hypothetical protein VNC84_04480 [Gammaproteobacteria bacterium]|jgi:hypothetical protein|nr:hypothetical protein [Gammaproteobacteria bacterium]
MDSRGYPVPSAESGLTARAVSDPVAELTLMETLMETVARLDRLDKKTDALREQADATAQLASATAEKINRSVMPVSDEPTGNLTAKINAMHDKMKRLKAEPGRGRDVAILMDLRNHLIIQLELCYKKISLRAEGLVYSSFAKLLAATNSIITSLQSAFLRALREIFHVGIEGIKVVAQVIPFASIAISVLEIVAKAYDAYKASQFLALFDRYQGRQREVLYDYVATKAVLALRSRIRIKHGNLGEAAKQVAELKLDLFQYCLNSLPKYETKCPDINTFAHAWGQSFVNNAKVGNLGGKAMSRSRSGTQRAAKEKGKAPAGSSAAAATIIDDSSDSEGEVDSVSAQAVPCEIYSREGATVAYDVQEILFGSEETHVDKRYLRLREISHFHHEMHKWLYNEVLRSYHRHDHYWPIALLLGWDRVLLRHFQSSLMHALCTIDEGFKSAVFFKQQRANEIACINNLLYTKLIRMGYTLKEHDEAKDLVLKLSDSKKFQCTDKRLEMIEEDDVITFRVPVELSISEGGVSGVIARRFLGAEAEVKKANDRAARSDERAARSDERAANADAHVARADAHVARTENDIAQLRAAFRELSERIEPNNQNSSVGANQGVRIPGSGSVPDVLTPESAAAPPNVNNPSSSAVVQHGEGASKVTGASVSDDDEAGPSVPQPTPNVVPANAPPGSVSSGVVVALNTNGLLAERQRRQSVSSASTIPVSGQSMQSSAG